MATPQQSTLNVINKNSYMRLTGSGDYNVNSKNLYLNSHGYLQLQADSNTVFKTTSGNTTFVNETGIIKLEAHSQLPNTIVISASNNNGSVLIHSGSNGITLESNNGGDTNIYSYNGNINIGYDDGITGFTGDTQYISIDSAIHTYIGSSNIDIHASDQINILSDTGNIFIGSGPDDPFLTFENGNLLLNQSNSSLDYQLDVRVTDQSSSNHGYNGVAVNSSNSDVAAELVLMASHVTGGNVIPEAKLSIGTQPANSNSSYYQEYLAFQDGSNVIAISGVEFNGDDIGRNIYWPAYSKEDTIIGLSTKLLPGSNADISTSVSPVPSGSNIVVYGTYSGTSSRTYLIEVDTGNVDINGDDTNDIPTFKWSDNGGSTFNERLILLSDYSTASYTLNNGIQVKFPQIGYTYQQQFIFSAKVTAVVTNTDSITTPTQLYTLQPYYSYIKTDTGADIVIGTNDTEKMRITGDGAIGIQITRPDAGMHINSKYGETLQVNQYSNGYQLNSAISALTTGGYVIAWQSTYTSDQYIANNGNIWVQRYMTDGSRFGNSMQVNSTVGAKINNTFPSIANDRYPNSDDYMVVWASGNTHVSSPNSYNILGRIIKDNLVIGTGDIPIATISGTNELYPKVTGILKYNTTSKTYLSEYIVTWAETTNTTSQIKCKTISNTGVVGSPVNITAITGGDAEVAKYPAIIGLSSVDPHHPGGFVVSYMSSSSINSDQFVVKFKVVNIDENGSIGTIGAAVTIKEPGDRILYSDGLQTMDYISAGGFVLSMYENYVNNTGYYVVDNYIRTDDNSVFGTIISASIASNPPTITVDFTIGTLTTNQEFIIVNSSTPSNTLRQRVANIQWTDTDTAVITLDFGYRSIVAYAFNSNATVTSNRIWENRTVNTTRLYNDTERLNSALDPNSIFAYTRPAAQISINDTGSCMVAWTSGSIPRLYYSILDTLTGVAIGEEALVSTDNLGIKHRNAALTYLMSIQGNDYGHIISWDNQNLNQTGTGIYQCLVGYNHYIFKAEDHTSNICLTHNGRVGLGVKQPTDTLHIKSNGMRTNYARSETGLLRLQNNVENVNTSSVAQLSINMANGDNSTLATISAGNVPEYVGLFPYPDNMALFYDFDNTGNNLAIRDRTRNAIDAALVNFDTENCWRNDGLINTCLEFNGAVSSNVYAFAKNNDSVTKVFNDSNKATISAWIKVPSVFQSSANGSNITIISTGSSGSTVKFGSKGTYSFDVRNYSGKLGLCFQISNSSAIINYNANVNVTGGVYEISADVWHYVAVVYDTTTSNKFNLNLDGKLCELLTPIPTLEADTITQSNLIDINIGVKHAATYKDYFIGYMNQIKVWSGVALSSAELLSQYNFSKSSAPLKNALYFNTYGTLTNQNIFIDNTNSINNLSFRSSNFNAIRGSGAQILTNSSNLLVTSSGESANTFVKRGDTVKLSVSGLSYLNNSGDEFNVIDIFGAVDGTSNNTVILDRPPITGSGSSTVNTDKQLVYKPSILSMLDYNNKLCGFVDYNGNAVFGAASSLNNKLTVAADPTSNIEVPCMTLVNKKPSNLVDFKDVYGSRGSTIKFKGYSLTDSNIGEIASISAYNYQWIDGPSSGNVGAIMFKVNSGGEYSIKNNDVPILSIAGNACVGINTQNPRTSLNVNAVDDREPVVLLTSSNIEAAVFSCKSSVKFGNKNDGSVMDSGFAGIQGSFDYPSKTTRAGRLDFCTSNTINGYELTKHMSIDSCGNVGVNMIAPVAPFHVAPRLLGKSFYFAENATSATVVKVIIGAEISNSDISSLIGGYLVVNDSGLTKRKILTIAVSGTTGNYNVTVDSPITVLSTQSCELHYYGLIVGYNGNVDIGSLTSRTVTAGNELTLNGTLVTTKIINVAEPDANYDVVSDDYIILLSTSASPFTANLNGVRLNGKNLIIKNTSGSSKNIIIKSGSGTDTYENTAINGTTGYTISSVASMDTLRLVCQYSSTIAKWWRI